MTSFNMRVSITCAIALLFAASGLYAQGTHSIQADAANQSRGIQKYEVDILSNQEPDTMFIQVVGNSTHASGFVLKSDASGYEILMRMTRSGQTLTVTLATDLSSGTVEDSGQTLGWWDLNIPAQTGMNGLGGNQAWETLMYVMKDINFAPGLEVIGFPLNPPSPACNASCRAQYPIPADCNGAWDEFQCCINEVRYDRCRRECQCEADYDCTSPPPFNENCSQCMLQVVGLAAIDALGCVPEVWPF